MKFHWENTLTNLDTEAEEAATPQICPFVCLNQVIVHCITPPWQANNKVNFRSPIMPLAANVLQGNNFITCLPQILPRLMHSVYS